MGYKVVLWDDTNHDVVVANPIPMSYIKVNDDLIPSGSYDLGSSSNPWKDGYFSDAVHINDNFLEWDSGNDVLIISSSGALEIRSYGYQEPNIIFDAGGISVNSSMSPVSTNSVSLGNSSKYWKAVYTNSLYIKNGFTIGGESGADASLDIYSWNTTDSDGGTLYLSKRGNSSDGSGAVKSGGLLGSVEYRGWDGSALFTGAVIKALAEANWASGSSSNHSTKLEFVVYDSGDTANSIVFSGNDKAFKPTTSGISLGASSSAWSYVYVGDSVVLGSEGTMFTRSSGNPSLELINETNSSSYSRVQQLSDKLLIDSSNKIELSVGSKAQIEIMGSSITLGDGATSGYQVVIASNSKLVLENPPVVTF